jgi:hypothetical protein
VATRTGATVPGSRYPVDALTGLGFRPPKNPELRRCFFLSTFVSLIVDRSSGIGPGFEVVDSGPNEPKLFLRSLFPKLCAITREEHGAEEERQRVVEGLGAGVELREEQSSHRGCVVSHSSSLHGAMDDRSDKPSD